MKYLILGAGGMAGHTIAIYLKEQGEDVIGLARRKLSFCETEIADVSDFKNLKRIVISNEFDCIINCIGLLNRTAEDHIENAILLNSYLPHYLVSITKNLKTKIIHMSTDCVFSGERGNYKETDFPDGKTYYDRTKALGEINDNKNLTFRNSIIGPDINQNGIGLFNWFMKQTDEINGYEKSVWTGVTTLTLAKAMHLASKSDLTGIYNLVNNEKISKYELVSLFNVYTNKNLTIHKIAGIDQDKSLICTRNDFDFKVPDYKTMIYEMIEWIKLHKVFYEHYHL